MVVLLLVNALLFAVGDTEDGILTDHLLVQFHEGSYDEAPQVAMEHGFESVRKVRCEVPKNRLKLVIVYPVHDRCDCVNKYGSKKGYNERNGS